MSQLNKWQQHAVRSQLYKNKELPFGFLMFSPISINAKMSTVSSKEAAHGRRLPAARGMKPEESISRFWISQTQKWLQVSAPVVLPGLNCMFDKVWFLPAGTQILFVWFQGRGVGWRDTGGIMPNRYLADGGGVGHNLHQPCKEVHYCHYKAY